MSNRTPNLGTLHNAKAFGLGVNLGSFSRAIICTGYIHALELFLGGECGVCRRGAMVERGIVAPGGPCTKLEDGPAAVAEPNRAPTRLCGAPSVRADAPISGRLTCLELR